MKKMLSEFLDLPVRDLWSMLLPFFWSNDAFRHFSNFHIKISLMKDNDENIKNKINTTNLNFVAGS